MSAVLIACYGIGMFIGGYLVRSEVARRRRLKRGRAKMRDLLGTLRDLPPESIHVRVFTDDEWREEARRQMTRVTLPTYTTGKTGPNGWRDWLV